jgi:hypothetical protein
MSCGLERKNLVHTHTHTHTHTHGFWSNKQSSLCLSNHHSGRHHAVVQLGHLARSGPLRPIVISTAVFPGPLGHAVCNSRMVSEVCLVLCILSTCWIQQVLHSEIMTNKCMLSYYLTSGNSYMVHPGVFRRFNTFHSSSWISRIFCFQCPAFTVTQIRL